MGGWGEANHTIHAAAAATHARAGNTHDLATYNLTRRGRAGTIARNCRRHTQDMGLSHRP